MDIGKSDTALVTIDALTTSHATLRAALQARACGVRKA